MLLRDPLPTRRPRLPRLSVLSHGLVLLSLSGCMVGPDYHAPQTAVPAHWTGATTAPSSQPSTQPTAVIDLVNWWKSFDDPALTSLVERAVAANLDLRLATSRLRQARANRGVVAADLFPAANAAGAYTRANGGTTAAGGVAPAVDLFQAGLDASWEVDVFGGIRRNVESADADIQAAVADRRDTLVSLVAEVGLDYISLRGFQQQIIYAQNNLTVQQHSAEVTRQKFRGGLVGTLDVANADAQVAATASAIPPLATSVRQTIYSLSVLLARDPAALVQELTPTGKIPHSPPEVPLGLPSDLLRRRPDIRRAEAQIHSATALIGAATADLFPKFSISGAGGFQSGRVESFLSKTSRTWSFGPGVAWNVFDAWKTWSNIEVQNALQEQALLTYEKTVLTALQDVENALVAYANEQERRKALVDAVAANSKAVEVSTQLYSEGQTDFLNVLVAQQSLFNSQSQLVQSITNLSTDMVALYKALGGGWNEEDKAKGKR